MKISVGELKSHLSRYLVQAQQDPIEITSHRKVVARLIGVVRTEDSGLQRLLASGAACWGGGKPAGARVRLTPRGRPVSDLLVEDRG